MNAENEMRFERMQDEIDSLQTKLDDKSNKLDETKEALKRLLDWALHEQTTRALNCTGVLGDYAEAVLQAKEALE